MLWPRPCALVATIHDLAPFHVGGKYDPARMVYGKVVARALARRQDAIIAVSQNTADDIHRFFRVPRARVTVVPNGLDHTRFAPGDVASARAKVQQRMQLDHPYCLYVSRLEHPGKNHVRLIDAFSRFKAATGSDWQLAFAGSDWTGADVIHKAASFSPVRDDIRFLGFVPDAELANLYRAAGAVVYPSLFEGFGFPPVEAMACGCPVLSSQKGALAEVVGDAAGFLDPEDVQQMAGALTRVVQDSAYREQLRAAGLQNGQRFHWDDNAERVIEIYRRVARSEATDCARPLALC